MLDVKCLPAQLRCEGLEEKLTKLCEENDIVFMAIFGSLVRGNYGKKSDIDILIKFEGGKCKTLFDLIEIEDELEKILGKRIDLLTVNSISPYLKDEILRSMKVIYEKR